MDKKNMKIDIKILEELSRFNSINKYINEQTLPPAPGAEGEIPPPAEAAPVAPGAPAEPGLPADPNAAAPGLPAPPQDSTPIDVNADPDVEKIENGKGEGEKEELEITDLVKSQKNVEQKQEEYFNNLFNQIQNLEKKLGEMDNIVTKLNTLEAKVEKYREKTPQEKLELRSLDSGPFNQKLTDFFIDKQEDMEKSGKNEYILTKDDVTNFTPNELKKTFRDFGDEENKFKQI
jgi:hypothetical protein